ncbi:MAG: hypothetical protein ABR981_01550 [Candidatus Micrarchaeaceae archaeon]
MKKKKHNIYKYIIAILVIVLAVIVTLVLFRIMDLPINSEITSLTVATTSAKTTSSTTTTTFISTVRGTSTIPRTTTRRTTIPTTTISTTIFRTTTSITTSVSTTSSSTTIPNQNQTSTFIVIPNFNGRGSRFTYVPIQTSNITSIAFICKYFPVGFQNPLFLNGTYGKNFSSMYTLEGQLQISNLGQSLNVSNATYASYNFGVACN